MTTASRTGGPLGRLRVLDLTSVVMGPYCTQILADLGAEVIKLESPGGDTLRVIGPGKHPKSGGTFLNLNRGKKGLVVDLQQPAGREVCLRIASDCDVLIHSIRPQAIERLGLGYQAISAVRPDIIYCNLFGFSRDGCYAGRPAYDDIIQAMSGLAALQTALSEKPQFMGTVVADKVGALTGVYAILAAVIHRMQTGEGQELDVSMFEAAVSFVMAENLGGAAFRPPLGRAMYSRVIAPQRRPFRTRTDDIAVMVYTDAHWRRFAEVAGLQHLLDDPRFVGLGERTRNTEAFYAVVQDVLLQRDAAEWLAMLFELDIPAARIQSPDDLFEDPHLQQSGFFQPVDAGEHGTLQLPGTPVRFGRSPAGFDRAGPALGEHTRELLGAHGYSADEIDALCAAGTVRAPST